VSARLRVVGLAVGCAAGIACLPGAASASQGTIQTVPAVAGVQVSRGGQSWVSDSRGRISLPARLALQPEPLHVRTTLLSPDSQARFLRWYHGALTLGVWYRVRPSFVARDGKPVPSTDVSQVTLHNSLGALSKLHGTAPVWLQGSRVVPFTTGLHSKQISYSIDSVTVDGTNVVNRSQQHFFPSKRRELPIALLFNVAHFTARDAIFHFPVGRGVRLTYPSGKVVHRQFGSKAAVTVAGLPRGSYEVSVDAPGVSFTRPIALSRNQDVSLAVITWLDIGLLTLAGVAACGGLFVYRRRRVGRAGHPSAVVAGG
jgi:hypothetical protein